MTRRILLCLLFMAAMLSSGASSREAPKVFQLILPDFFETPFAGDAVIELPDRPIQRLRILIFQAIERNISSGSIQVWVNGKGMSNVLDSRGVDQGLLLTMDPENLRKRPDELFDARENTVEILATDKRDRRYYQSWILRTGGHQNAYYSYSGHVSPDDPKGVPPDLILQQPAKPPSIPYGETKGFIQLKGLCWSANFPTVLKVNGRLIQTIPSGRGSFEYSVEIQPGMRELELEAIDQKENRRTVIIPIARQKSVPVRARVSGHRYAIVIGISHYELSPDGPPPLPYASADAAALARHLQSDGGFPRENVRLLLDDQATLGQIRTAVFDFAAKAQAEDLLVVYFAGHALHDPRFGKTERIFFAPFGARLRQLDATALSFDDLDTLLNRSIRSNHTFLLFDAGHQTDGDWKALDRSLVNNHLLNLFSDQQGRAVFVSASAGEESHAMAGGQASTFAHWLIRGLSGESDLNQDHVITAQELFQFVTEKVRQETQDQQNPRYRLPASSAGETLAEIP